jgi:hypothetical protein
MGSQVVLVPILISLATRKVLFIYEETYIYTQNTTLNKKFSTFQNVLLHFKISKAITGTSAFSMGCFFFLK